MSKRLAEVDNAIHDRVAIEDDRRVAVDAVLGGVEEMSCAAVFGTGVSL